MAIIEPDGTVLWSRDDVAAGRTIPQIRDGVLIYVDTDGRTDGRLVAYDAPATGSTPGDWPMIGSNPGNTNRAL